MEKIVKKNKIKIILFLLIIFMIGSEEVKSMIKRLKPLKITSLIKINNITGIGLKDHIAGINGSGKFIVIKINKNELITVKNAAGIFPTVDGMEVNSDNEYNFVWNTRGRGFYAADIDTKLKGHCVASSNANDKIVNCQLIDPENKIFLIELSRLGRLTDIEGFIYVLYDLNSNDIIFESKVEDTIHYRFNKDNILTCKIYGENNEFGKWYLTDLNGKNITENNLTKKLTELNFFSASKTKVFSTKSNTLLTKLEVNNETVYYTVRWDEKFEEIKIEPIIFQRPFGNFLDEAFEFSQDGKWVKTLRIPFSEGRDMPWELIIYHVTDIYPQGLSMPIFCGYAMESTPGAFMDHEKWGMCYVQLIGGNTLYVYKLNEGLKLMAENAEELLK